MLQFSFFRFLKLPRCRIFVSYPFYVFCAMNKTQAPCSQISWSSVSTGQPAKFSWFLPVGPPASEYADIVVPWQCSRIALGITYFFSSSDKCEYLVKKDEPALGLPNTLDADVVCVTCCCLSSRMLSDPCVLKCQKSTASSPDSYKHCWKSAVISLVGLMNNPCRFCGHKVNLYFSISTALY